MRTSRLPFGIALFVPFTVLVLLVSAAPAGAQISGTATLRGTVMDPSGGVLPGVTVTLTNQGTRGSRDTTSDDRGGYVFGSIFSGTYTLKGELQGFKTYEQPNIIISPGDTRGVDISLEVGAQTETVTVTAQREIVQTETGAREGVVTAQQIDNLSVIGRSVLELLRIMPGVVAPEPEALESVGFLVGGNNTQGYAVNGIRSSNNVVQLDGANLIDIGSNNGVILNPNNDMVQEVKVQTSNYAAEYGSSGMQVSAITKAGTSAYRGELYDYIRHYKFAANDRSNSIAGVEKGKSQYNFPGGNIGGPLLLPGTDWNSNRDKMFFFFGLEVQRQKVDSGSSFGVVPTAAQRRGDFSGNLACIGDHLNQPCGAPNIPGGFPGAGSPAPGANIAPYIHPIGAKLMDFYPLPNHVDTKNNRFNYVYNALEPNNRVEWTTRVDYNLTNNTRMYVRVARQTELREEPRGIWWPASQVALPTPNLADSNGRGASLNLVSVLGPNTTNELLVSYAKLELDNDYKDPSKVSLASTGIPDFGFFPGQSPYAPVAFINDWGGNQVSNLWSPTSNFIFAHNDTRMISDKLTKIWNSHALKFGFQVEQVNKWQNFQNNENMLFVFDTWIPGTTGHQIGDLLVGRPTFVEQGTKVPNGHFRLHNYDGFAQDSWKVRPNLTLEFGVRFSYMPNNSEQNELGAIFDPAFYDATKPAFLDAAKTRFNGVRYVSQGDVEPRLTRNRDPYVMPRINFAWDMTRDSKNVLRGGWGIFLNRPMGNTVYDVIRVPPNIYTANTDGWRGAGLGDGLGLTYDTISQVKPLDQLSGQRIMPGGASVSPFSIDYPETYSMSLSYARRLFFDQVVEAGYVGTRGRHLVSRTYHNVIPRDTLRGVINGVDLSVPANRVALDSSIVNRFRPFQAYDQVEFWDYFGESDYDSLQVTLSRQTSKTLQYFATYTLGKAQGTQGDEYTQLHALEPARTYGTLGYDRRHIFNLSWNYFVPDLAPGPNVVARGLLNGWQASGISTISSGYPIFLRFSGDLGSSGMSKAWFGTPDMSTGNSLGAITPVYLRDPRIKDARSVADKLFDINAIGIPGFGDSGPPQPPFDLRAPWRWNHDLTLFKNFRVNDTQKFQFRVGFFNMFNMAYASQRFQNDVDLRLETRCLRRVMAPTGVGSTVEVCDPTGGFAFTENTIKNFGKINLLRGHRVVEFALKYYF